MAKQTKAETKAAFEPVESVDGNPEMDSKYRLIIVAAQRSKQIQRGARPRVDMDIQRHKATRVALEEVQQGKIAFHFTEKE
ncbi:MAG TPA: DNA-directed RNA polymerase subunit omega [Pyrinomonadaceae bacterium]|jgi:DNA-directed RNA polymerase subunit omega|nr:DNA-directed RNA polymerase subunit omega [Pyrinomonadaceae bacterium]